MLCTCQRPVAKSLHTDAHAPLKTLNLEPKVAEHAKMERASHRRHRCECLSTDAPINRTTEHVASELHRRISFLECCCDRSNIDTIFSPAADLGGSKGSSKSLVQRQTSCAPIDPFRKIDTTAGFDSDYLSEIGPQMAGSVSASRCDDSATNGNRSINGMRLRKISNKAPMIRISACSEKRP